VKEGVPPVGLRAVAGRLLPFILLKILKIGARIRTVGPVANGLPSPEISLKNKS
jgi:hypothetical protein